MNANQRITELDDKIIFGKHRGKTFEEVLQDSPSYLEWCAEEEAIEFSVDMMDKLGKAMRGARPRWRRSI